MVCVFRYYVRRIIFQCVFRLFPPETKILCFANKQHKMQITVLQLFFSSLFKHKNFVLKFKLNCLTDAAHSKVKTKLHTEQSETILERGNDSFSVASGSCLCNCNWIVWNEIQKLNKLFSKVGVECG